MERVIFVSGAHGVGKTRLLQLVSPLVNIPTYTASALIAQGRQDVSLGTTKIVEDPDLNQEILAAKIKQILTHTPAMLLDGHTVLMTSGETSEAIPLHHFNTMQIKGVILLESDPSSVAHNLHSRDGVSPPLKSIGGMLQLERRQSARIAAALGVRYSQLTLQYDDSDAIALAWEIQELMKGDRK